MKTSKRLKAVKYIAFILASAVFLIPVWTVIVISLTTEAEVYVPGSALWPKQVTFENFERLFVTYPFGSWFGNSLIVTILFTIGQLLSCTFTAFALAHFKFRGRGLLFAFVLATMMLPFQVQMVPMFLIMKQLRLTDTLFSLFVPAFFGDVTGAVAIFLLRQAFFALPVSYSEAAYIDGATPLDIYSRIYIPLIKPFIAVVLLLAFMTSWNDFSRPLVYISKIGNMTVTGGLSFFRTEWQIDWSLTMTGTLMAILPCIILYIFLQRYFKQMVLTSGIK